MTAVSYQKALQWWSEQDSEAVAVVCNDQSINRGELDRSSNRLARAYRQLGVSVDDRITICVPNSIEFIQICFAAWKLGATPQPLSSKLPVNELVGLIELAEPALIVGVNESDHSGILVLPMGYCPDRSLSDDPLEEVVSKNAKALASGGSTGKPKLIVDTAQALFDPEVAVNHMQLEGCMLVPGPLYHNGPFITIFQCLLSGGKAVVMPHFDASEAIRLIEHYKVDWVLFVPTMMHRIWRLSEEQRTIADMRSLRIVNSTAAPVPAWLKSAWIDWIGAEKIYESYGGSERIGGTQITGTEWLEHPGSVGKPVGGALVRVLDIETHKELPPEEIGEVYMRAAINTIKSTFYVGAEDQEYDGYQTLGDMGYVDEDGYLYLVDRRVDMIVSGGANIYPAEIECVIDEFPAVRSSAVVGLPDDDLGQKLHAIVDAPGGLHLDKLLVHLGEHLVRYKVPRSVEVVDEILRDDSGKLRRSALREARL